MKLVDLQKLDQAHKGDGAYKEEWEAQSAYYHDQARKFAVAANVRFEVSQDERPPQLAWLRRIVDHLAVCYDRPPVRSLWTAAGKRLSETSAEHRALVDVYRAAQVDLAMRKADRIRALHRQAILRIYPSDVRGRPLIRVIEPQYVLRDPDPADPNTMDGDRAFALELGGGSFELWERVGGGWTMRVVDPKGVELPPDAQQFEGGLCPYDALPVQIIYDEYPCGVPWLPPRTSRRAWQERIDALAVDLHNLVRYEAHTDKVATVENETIAKRSLDRTGIGLVHVLGDKDDVKTLPTNPKIVESIAVVEAFTRFWSVSEDLPVSELDRSRTSLTGPALRALMEPLIQRRESRIPLCQDDERELYGRVRAVHNLHRASAPPSSRWRQLPPLPEQVRLEAEIAEFEIPIDPEKDQLIWARAMALGGASLPEMVAKMRRVGREQAISILERIAEDNSRFPPAPAFELESAQEPDPEDDTPPSPDHDVDHGQQEDSPPPSLTAA